MQNDVAKRPSKKQRELLEFIDGFIREHGYGPSYREIMRLCGYKSVSTVAVHVDGLIRKGHLVKRDHSARSLAVVKAGDASQPLVAVVAADTKWLVDSIDAKFADYDAKPTQKKLDKLYVLVGALHVLELDDAARAFKSRLQALAKTE